MRLPITSLRILLLILIPFSLVAQWTPKQTSMRTQWAKDVDLNNPLPEYPRPQMVRADWLSLNGYWEFKSGLITDILPQGQTLSGKIVVPFPIEAPLSGVVRHYDRLWYRRTFTVPENWSGKHILIHFDAVDWESEVFINGFSMGIHKGGYDAFSYDITAQITGSGPQEVIVRVYDPTKDYGQPRGKQTTAPSGAMYTCVTGIWQTVWLEPVAEKSISGLKMIPDIDKGLLSVTVNTADSTGLTVTATAKDGETVVGSVTSRLNSKFTIPIPSAKLWSPDSPFLYDMTVVVKSGLITVDSVSSYFGMRKISRNKVGTANKLFLNNEFVFQMGPLDQGFWPEGIYTAPTDAALKSDIENEKALGFNMVRKHIKVEPQRWYYWADKLGILVWQDMPSANSYDTPSGVTTDQVAHELEMTRMINSHINSPSIIMWVMFNEGCGQFDTKGRVDLARSLDPSRLVNQGSGGGVASPVSAGDVIDAHRYPAPLCEFQPNQASVSGEYGGVFYNVPNHQWGSPGTNTDHAKSAAELVTMYSSLADQVNYYKTFSNLSAAIYTQITDVETEINGMLTYDRVPKVDMKLFKAINERIIHQKIIQFDDAVPTSQQAGRSWKYTTTLPATSWTQQNFDDSAWKTAPGGFGSAGTPGAIIHTAWNSSDIWMRQQFTLTDVKKEELPKLALNLHHDDNCDVYINGMLAGSFNGYTSAYEIDYIKKEARNVLIINEKNTISVHCFQNAGGQYIDCGIVKIINENDTTFAYHPQPALNLTDVNTESVLSWSPGNMAISHNVFLSTNAVLTNSSLVSSQTDTTFNAMNLLPGMKYYWRVDEVNNTNVKTGYVWNFTTKQSTGINNPAISLSRIYPNPLKKDETLSIDLGSNAGNIESIGIWSDKGILLYKQSVNGVQKVNLNLLSHKMSSGVYFIRAEKDGQYGSAQRLVYIQ